MSTVREEAYNVLRALGMTTIFGNPGSMELPFLSDFPEDFTYILGLQEAAVVGMADGYSLATRQAVLVNVHTAPGLGNAMGNVITAFYNRTPLVITAGQQVRAMLLGEAYLFARQAEDLPKPYVKWSYEPVRPQDIPAALARAYYTAMQPPRGPVFLSLPMDDWDAEAEPCEVRRVIGRTAPDPQALRQIAERLRQSRSPAFVTGGGVDRSGAWDLMIKLAEQTNAAVWGAPVAGRATFPESHSLFQGFLPYAQATLAERLAGHDVVVVFGAPVFNYYLYAPGRAIPPNTELFQITDDPGEASRAVAGTSVIGDVALAIESLISMLPAESQRPHPRGRPVAAVPVEGQGISGAYLMYTLGRMMREDSILVDEIPSFRDLMLTYRSASRSGGYYVTASGGLGFAMPAAVGLQIAEPERRVVCVVGDGSSMYSIQCLYTAVQHHVPVIYVVVRNQEYAILKSFANYEHVSGIPGLDIPGIDVVQIAKGMGCDAWSVDRSADLPGALQRALDHQDGPALVEVTVEPRLPSLL
ncbi:MAG: benzoylformate decarboxylase [Chloroflexi bacterium]|nr:benzoylformate decarboxylase [Chloroflexota bacterium]